MNWKTRVEQLESVVSLLTTRARLGSAADLSFEEWLPEVSPYFEWNWRHLVHIREHLDRVTAGEIRKLMIFCPPRHGKSELVTVRYPVWTIERDPAKRVILGGYNQPLAERFSRKARRIAEPRIPLAMDRNAVADWETATGGGVRAVGVGSGVTGTGANLIIVDDPTKSREEANSLTYRDRVWDWYRDDLYTRLEPGGAIVLIMTRWHQDDLAGRILASDDAANWTVVNLPAFAEANDPLGRAEGEALCPERFDEAALDSIKQVLGSSFEALYQQRPSALEGAIFKREWWKTYSELPTFKRVIHSWDTSFKTGADNDYSVCTIWGESDTGFYLVYRFKQRVEFPELKRAVTTLAGTHRPHAVLVEDKASGQSLIQEIKRETSLPILAVKVDTDKISRAYAVTPVIEAGKVFLPESAPWLDDYLDTMAAFPNADHDDDVDSTTQALNWLIGRGDAMGLYRYYEEEARRAQAG
jgi:predicted phage terminase large subunit-like protein